MSYQTFHPNTGSVQTVSEDNPDDENSPLYPFGKPVFLSGLSVQMAFVRKVWVIFTSELVAVTFTTALLIYMYEWRHFLQRHIWAWWVSIVMSFILLIALTYKSNDDFQPPWYLVIIYTCFNAYAVGGLGKIN
ncbi:10032_t:CDS:2 [Funneliformis geosporum]|nr:10032_t:CDS:2 [Funneliformis geosporum]